MNEPTHNIYSDEEDYFAAYNKGGETPHNEVLEYQGLTFRMFTTDEGKKWLKMTKETLSNTLVSLNVSNPGYVMAEAQGMLKQILQIEKHISTHQEYVNSI